MRCNNGDQPALLRAGAYILEGCFCIFDWRPVRRSIAAAAAEYQEREKFPIQCH